MRRVMTVMYRRYNMRMVHRRYGLRKVIGNRKCDRNRDGEKGVRSQLQRIYGNEGNRHEVR
jgi:hypothetical protein